MAARQAPLPPVLEFSTLEEGLPVRIDGQLYQIRSANALSLSALKRLERVAPRMATLLQRDDLTDDEAQDVAAGLVQLCDLILDAPAEVRARLKDAQRVSILQAFTQLRSPMVAGAIAGLAQATRSAGKTRSRGSRGATAAARRSTGTNVSRSA